MTWTIDWVWRRVLKPIRDDVRGQDLIEYALMAGLVALAAGATLPSFGGSIGQVFSRVTSEMAVAASGS